MFRLEFFLFQPVKFFIPCPGALSGQEDNKAFLPAHTPAYANAGLLFPVIGAVHGILPSSKKNDNRFLSLQTALSALTTKTPPYIG